MKVLLGFMLAVFATISCAQVVPLNAKSAIVVDADSNDVLLPKNVHDVRSIASITKMMTAIVTLDAGLDLEEKLTITSEDADATRLRGKHTGTSLPVGAELTRAELLHLALMNSQNRAAAALGRTYPGGSQSLIDAMNTKAQELGMKNTTFVDPTGLYNGNTSTVEDLALMVKAAAEYPEIRDFSTSTSFELTTYQKRKRPIGFGSTNVLVTKGDWDVVVQKTGYITAAGRCLVMMTTIASKRVIIVLLDTNNNRARARDAITIRQWLETGVIPSVKAVTSADPYKRMSKRKRR